jgi:23S rRNA pseudouridine1911/1915/1917 synthase
MRWLGGNGRAPWPRATFRGDAGPPLKPIASVLYNWVDGAWWLDLHCTANCRRRAGATKDRVDAAAIGAADDPVPMMAGPRPAGNTSSLIADTSDGGHRLDEFLASTLAIGRRAATRLALRVRVNGRRATKGQRLRAGDVVELLLEDGAAIARAAPLEIVRAAAEVLVLAKPAGVPSVGLRGSDGDSLAARIAARFPHSAQIGRAGESGLVHRLDTGTSGLLLAARTAEAYAALRAQFRAHAVAKEYLALVAGRIDAAVRIATPIGQHRNTRRRMRALATERPPRRYTAQRACTDVTIERALADATLVRARTTTGVRHQIRVHLASIGHPLLGDPLYGPAPGAQRDGFLLHASRITWHDPSTGEGVTDELPLPAGWQPILDRLAP